MLQQIIYVASTGKILDVVEECRIWSTDEQALIASGLLSTCIISTEEIEYCSTDIDVLKESYLISDSKLCKK